MARRLPNPSPTPGAYTQKNLEDDAAKKLASSGLTLKDAEAQGIESRLPHETFAVGFWKWHPVASLWFPYFDPFTGEPVKDGDQPYGRARWLQKPKNLPGEKETDRKYLQPTGSPPHAYFPRGKDWPSILNDPTVPLVITEGELKSIAACNAGFNVLGLGGIYSFRFRSKNHPISLLPTLDQIAWSERQVTIIFDTDQKQKTIENTEKARQMLANQLIQRGAEVSYVDLPNVATGGKTGLDDFLVVKGKDGPAELADLIANAEPMELAWKLFFTRSSTGNPVPSIDNVCIALENAPELDGCFKFNEMSESVDLVRALPGATMSDLPRPITDDDILALQGWLQRYGSLLNIGSEAVADAVRLVALDHRYHPVRQMLEGLQWDGTRRLHNWLPVYFGAEIEDADGKSGAEYLAQVGEMFPVGMVARVFEPGCKMDYTLVFEGLQGVKKSTAAQILAGARYFTDELAEIGRDDVRTAESLAGMWVVELPELSAIRRSDQEAIKAFLTRTEDKFIPKYGRNRITRKRQCVFIGSTNKSSYLRDGTGARRFWPVKCTKMDLDGLRQVRDQLLAEAYARYREGAQWWPDHDFEKQFIEPEQAKRQEEEVFEGPVMKFAELYLKSGDDKGISTSTILMGLEIPLEKHNQMMLERVADILKRHGWQRKHTRTGKVWLPPAEEAIVVMPPKGRKTAKTAKSGTVVPIRQRKF